MKVELKRHEVGPRPCPIFVEESGHKGEEKQILVHYLPLSSKEEKKDRRREGGWHQELYLPPPLFFVFFFFGWLLYGPRLKYFVAGSPNPSFLFPSFSFLFIPSSICVSVFFFVPQQFLVCCDKAHACFWFALWFHNNRGALLFNRHSITRKKGCMVLSSFLLTRSWMDQGEHI